MGAFGVWDFGFLSFEFVSDFGIRISCFKDFDHFAQDFTANGFPLKPRTRYLPAFYPPTGFH
jgi:hypothetical protein